MAPNQFAHDTPVTPGTRRIFSAYVSGSENTSDTELRVTSRADELAFAPAYHASTIVRSNPNAVIATTMPTIVSVVRSLWRSAFFSTSSATYMTFLRGSAHGQWTSTPFSRWISRRAASAALGS